MVIPTMIFMMIIAKLLVLALIGEKWLPSVIFLQILCVVGIFHQMMRINNDALISKGFVGVALKQEIIRKAMYVAAILITFNFSLTIMLYGIAVQTIFSYIIMVMVTDKVVKVNAVDQFKDALPYFIISIVSGVPIVLMIMLMDLNVYIDLLLSGVVFSAIYFVLNRIFGLDGFNDFFSLILRGKSKYFVKSK
jgi:O-antigen/teichoic acid export membrane protein